MQCACGCGTPLPPLGKQGKPIRYIHGHNPRRPLEQRLWEKVDFGDPDECWPYTGARDRHGYGRIGLGNLVMAASRVAYMVTIGDPGQLAVLHSCDNPPCCNPLHLWTGTPKENTQDSIAKGRFHYRWA